MLLKSLTVLSLSALSIAHAIPPADQHPSYSIPSVHDSAVLARRIVNLSKIGTLSTVFQPSARSQDDNNYDEEAISDNLVGIPIGLPDYFADCNPESDNGNPTILAIGIATPFRNVRAGSNISLAVEWVPPFPPSKRISLWSRVASLFYTALSSDDGNDDTPDTVPYSAANLPRFSLIGYLEPLDSEATEDGKVAECFVAKHPDAQYWLPGNRIHRSRWVRLVVTHIYWVGGFGDRAYIGWIPVQEYNSVGRDEWKAVRLPGEKPGWKEWAVGDL